MLLARGLGKRIDLSQLGSSTPVRVVVSAAIRNQTLKAGVKTAESLLF
jgi:hypothetical protein